MDDLWDAIVVGLGPAGASAAAVMAGEGLRVLALERAPERRKACGGCLTEKVEGYLPPGWRDLVSCAVYGAEIEAGEVRIGTEVQRPLGFLVDRGRFDDFLRAAARKKGVETVTARVSSVAEERGSVRVVTPRGDYRARYVVGAGGANCPGARYVSGFTRRAKVVGMAGELPLPDRFRAGRIRLIMGLTGYGYGWFFPRSDVLNVGLTEYRLNAKRAEPVFRGLLERAARGGPVTWVRSRLIPCYDGKRRLSRGRVVLAGDAAGLVDPLSGEGIAYAVSSGFMAGRGIIETLAGRAGSTFSGYGLWVQENVYPEFRWASILARVIFRVPRGFTVLMKKRPELLVYYLELLGGRRTYRGFAAEVLKNAGGAAARRFFPVAP